MDPLTRLAAGVGLAILALYLGLGEALANITAVAALGVAVLACIPFILRGRAHRAVPVPEGPDAADRSRPLAGARGAKEQFEALQLANDSGDLRRLRECLTPAMFDLAQEAWRARGGAAQHIQVFGLEAQVVHLAGASGDHVLSVRFTGRVRGHAGEVPEDLDETWHLTKPRNGGSGWVLAGIQQAPQCATPLP